MIRFSAAMLIFAGMLFAAATASVAASSDFKGVTITDSAGNEITQCLPSQAVRFKAVYSLARPSLVLLHGYVTGSNWTVKLDYRIRLRLGGLYSVVWNSTIPFSANGDARADVFEYIPLVNELLQRTVFFTVLPFDAAYVGSDICNGCHGDIYAAWAQTKHYPYTGCESCHGPGGKHVSAPSPATIIVDTSADVCKPCHSRNDGSVIEAQDGFIKQQQQYNEWVSTKHEKVLQCADCHNPHFSVENDASHAIKVACRTCHPSQKLHLGMQYIECVSCHMAPAVKAETSTGTGPYRKGDTPSHIWRIKTEVDPSAMFSVNSAVKDAQGPFLTLNFSCLSCHNGIDARLYDFKSVQQTSTLVH